MRPFEARVERAEHDIGGMEVAVLLAPPPEVGGTLRATSILRALRTHRVIGHCDSGTVTWAAVP